MECVMLSTKYSLSYAITEVKSYICFSIIFYRKFPKYYMFNKFDVSLISVVSIVSGFKFTFAIVIIVKAHY